MDEMITNAGFSNQQDFEKSIGIQYGPQEEGEL